MVSLMTSMMTKIFIQSSLNFTFQTIASLCTEFQNAVRSASYQIKTIIWTQSQIVMCVHVAVEEYLPETQNDQETLSLPHSALFNRSTV
jgi:hypothetical protein